jgi:nucleoside-diphosphate-sugar epimerase
MARTMRLFAFGYGETAAALVRRLNAFGGAAAGTCRDRAKADAMRAQGVEAFVFAPPAFVLEPGALDGATHLLASIPPGDGDPALRHARKAILDCTTLQWIGYLSTTGVYGDHGGGWVDETTPIAPATERARARAAAEAGWLALGREAGVATHVFRLPGIYGPGRSALDQVRAGTARRIDAGGQVFSRIHVEDIALTLQASIARPRAGAIYNVADDEPSPQSDVVVFACELLRQPVPPLVPLAEALPTLSPMARSFYGESRRAANGLIKRELGVRLAFPTYREGLRAILAAEGSAGG